MNSSSFLKCIGLLTFLIIQSCSKDSSTPSGPSQIYVGVNYTVETTEFGVTEYWYNGQLTILTDSSYDSEGYGMAVAGSDVYICGYKTIANKEVPGYWMNGAFQSVSEIGYVTYSTVNSIAVNGSDVYLAGTSSIEKPSGNILNFPTMWKNGVPSLLVDTANCGPSSNAIAIAVDGNDIYCGGFYKGIPTTWKNGVTTQLTNGTNVGAILCMAVSNGNLYAGGNIGETPGYWVNGAFSSVPVSAVTGSLSGSVNALAVVGSTVYACGSNSAGEVLYWKNGVLTTLNANNQRAHANFISVKNSDVYIAGWIDTGKKFYYNLFPVLNTLYWKNGVPVTVSTSNTFPFGIVVQ